MRSASALRTSFSAAALSAPVSVFEIAYQTQLTPERIRQIKADAIKKLKEKYGNLPIGKLSQF